jgi:hypothetical protein
LVLSLTEKRDNLMTGEGRKGEEEGLGRGGGRVKSFSGEKAWSSINHSIL